MTQLYYLFQIGMLLTRGSEKNILKKLSTIDKNTMTINTNIVNMNYVMLETLSMMEDERGLLSYAVSSCILPLSSITHTTHFLLLMPIPIFLVCCVTCHSSGMIV